MLAKAAAVLEPKGHFVFDVNTAHKLALSTGTMSMLRIWGILPTFGKTNIIPKDSCAAWTWFSLSKRNRGCLRNCRKAMWKGAYPPELLRNSSQGQVLSC